MYLDCVLRSVHVERRTVYNVPSIATGQYYSPFMIFIFRMSNAGQPSFRLLLAFVFTVDLFRPISTRLAYKCTLLCEISRLPGFRGHPGNHRGSRRPGNICGVGRLCGRKISGNKIVYEMRFA